MAIQKGDMVMAGRGTPDERMGFVRSVEGDMAEVAWASGAVMPCAVSDLERVVVDRGRRYERGFGNA